MTDIVTSQEVVTEIVEVVDASVITEVGGVTTIVSQEEIVSIVETPFVETVLDTSPAQELVEVAGQGAPGPSGAPGSTGPEGPQGPAGPGGAGSQAPVRIYAPPATPTVVESINLSVYRSVKWMITVTDPFGGRYRMGEIMAFHDGVEAHFVHYGIFGSQVLYTFDVVVMAGSMVLRITNADTVTLTVDAVRVGNLTI